MLLIALVTIISSTGSNSYPKLNADPWESTTITVYIDENNLPEHYSPSYKIQVEKALEYWNDGGNGQLSYIPVLELVEEDNADILIMWVDNLESDNGLDDGVAGFARPYEINDRYERVDIVLEVGNYEGYAWRQFSDKTMRDLTKHELGHALGLAHSDDKNDIMYPSYEQKNNVDPLLYHNTRPFLIAIAIIASVLILYRGAGWVRSKKKREALEREIFSKQEK